MPDRPGALAAIGNTPIVRLSSFPGPGVAEVWVKLEAANPTGSYKDRMALAMIEGAEARGELQPGQTVVAAQPRGDACVRGSAGDGSARLRPT